MLSQEIVFYTFIDIYKPSVLLKFFCQFKVTFLNLKVFSFQKNYFNESNSDIN